MADPALNNYTIGVAAGLVKGAKNFTLFGVSPDVDTGDGRCTIWDLKATLRTRLYAPVGFEILSSSASDTLLGTGARQVVVTTLDGAYNEIVQVVNLNGGTPVQLTGTHLIVNAAVTVTTGTGRKNAGNITIRVTGGGSTQGYIAIGKGAHRSATFCAPAGKTAVFHNFFINAASGVGTGTVMIDPIIILPNGTEITALTESVTEGGPVAISVMDGFALPEMQTIQYEVVSVTNNNTFVGFGSSCTICDNT